MKKCILVIAVASLITACGDTPSNLGKKVQDKLTEQKISFESSTAKEKLDAYLRNNTALNSEARLSVSKAFKFAQDLSAIIEPNRARNIIESGEMAIACTITMLKEKDKVDQFLDNLMQSVTDVESKLILLEQIDEARARVISSAVNKENCLF